MKLKLALFASAAVLITSSASAYTFVAENQFYVGAGGGYGGMLTYQPSGYPQASDSTGAHNYTAARLRDGVAYRINMGYLWAFGHDQYGGEIGYMGYPKNTYNIDNISPSLDYKGHTVDLLIVLKHNYNNGGNVFAKAGAAYVTQKLSNPQPTNPSYMSVGNQSIFGTSHKILPEVALGAGYNLSQHIGVDFSVHYVFAGSSGQDLAIANSAGDANRVASVAAAFLGLYATF